MTVESLPNLTRLVRQCWEPIPANTDENDSMIGHDRFVVTGGQAQGGIFRHQGDDSAFAAVRAG